MTSIEPINLESKDLVAGRIEQLKILFPEIITEGDGSVDFEKLRLIMGEETNESDERYTFMWQGKRDSIRQSQTSSTATLRPATNESRGHDGKDGSFDSNNLYIEGDNLEVLKLLQRSYHGKVKLIYIDPPYNTGNDFVYEDDFKDSLTKYKETTSQATRSNPETTGRYHTNWLNMMYPRLRLARELLAEDGIIFISIDDNEVDNLQKICDEIFGEANHLGSFIWKRRQMVDSRTKTGVSNDHEYAVCYSKQGWRIRGKSTDMSKYSNPDKDPNGDWMSADMTGLATASQRPNLHYDLLNPITGKIYPCPPTGWRYEKTRMQELIGNNEVIFPKNESGRPRRKKYSKDLTGEFAGFSTVLNTVFNTQATRELRSIFDQNEYFDFPKPVELLKILIEQGTSPHSKDSDLIVLDFFSGSATTAHAVMQLNAEDGVSRKFICVQLPEVKDEKSEAFKAGYKNICEIGKERIRRAGSKIANEIDQSNRQLKLGEDPKPTPDIGFRVFKLDESGIDKQDLNTALMHGELFNEKNLLDTVVKPNRTEMDIVFEMMLKWGLELTLPIKEASTAGYKCYIVADGELICCMEPGLSVEALESIADIEPHRVLILDSILTDALKLNAVQIFKRVGARTGIEVELRTV